MDNKENKCDKCQDGCECSGCNGKGCGSACHDGCHGHCDGMCFGHHHRGGRWIVKALVILVIFWVGIQVGEMKSEFRSQYGYPMGGYRMMQGYQGYNVYAPTDAGRQGVALPVSSTTPRE